MVKTSALRIIDKMSDWIEDWLEKIKVCVVIIKKASDWADVKSRVPQGSLLGPLLFLIYINDNEIGLTSKIGANAINPKDVDALRIYLIKSGEWSEWWKMHFSCRKCKVMHIGDRYPQTNYSLLEKLDSKCRPRWKPRYNHKQRSKV